MKIDDFLKIYSIETIVKDNQINNRDLYSSEEFKANMKLCNTSLIEVVEYKNINNFNSTTYEVIFYDNDDELLFETEITLIK